VTINPQQIETWVKILSMLGAIVMFVWGVYKYFQNEQQRVENRRVEATKPFLDRQLKLYKEATQIAAVLATTRDLNEKDLTAKRFWELYFGELALVENKDVEAAMTDLKEGLAADAPSVDLQRYSLRLAHACRISLDQSWGIHAWTSSDSAAK
jgi:hypothetical protein